MKSSCEIFVIGMDMPCPLCGVVISSGEAHSCTNRKEPAKVLDERGRCCGRKPMVYKNRDYGFDGFRFCPRCDRAYAREENEQITNWAYKKQADGSFECQLSGGSK